MKVATKHKLKRRFRQGRRFLCASFAAAAFVPGGLVTPAITHDGKKTLGIGHSNPPAVIHTTPIAPPPLPSPPPTPPAPPPPPKPQLTEPNLITVFGTTAQRAPQSEDANGSQWNAIPSLQQTYMQNPADAAGYKSFLAQFNQYRGESLLQMANGVDALVNHELSYTVDSDCKEANVAYNNCHGSNYYWPAPIQTEMRRKGLCVDYAVLQYYIMRDLGVPVDRLFVADVSAEGDTNAADHTILLLNTAPTGQPASFVVMQDAPIVVPANNTALAGSGITMQNSSGQFVPPDFVFYDARNQDGYWITPGQLRWNAQNGWPAQQAAPAGKNIQAKTKQKGPKPA